MDCPHCGKVVVVKLLKDSNVGQSQPSADVDTNELASLLEVINMSSLDGKSLDFVTQTKERFAQYGERTRVSEKQLAWLRSLATPESADTW